MKRVAVVTDSVACIPRDLAAKYGIHVIPVRITVEGRLYRDIEEELPPEAVDKLQRSPVIDTTPWPPDVYCKAYEEAGNAADDIVHVVAFSQFTSTISLARAGAHMAQQKHPDLTVEVFDSASTAMSQGFIAMAAALAARQGKDLAGVVAEAERVKSRVSAAFTLDSLRYLARTGRAVRLASWASSLLHVAPVVGLSRGKEYPIGLTRSRKQAMSRLLEQVSSIPATEGDLHVAVMESGDTASALRLLDMIEHQFRPACSLAVRVSPVTQAVAGPGLLGVAFYRGD